MKRKLGPWRPKPWSAYERPVGFPPAPDLWDIVRTGSSRIVGPFETLEAAQAEADRRNALAAAKEGRPIATAA